MKRLVDLLDRPIVFHRCLVDVVGSVTGALLLGQALYWQKRTTHADGWWYKTADEWRMETGMGRYEFENARKACRKFLQIKKSGVPCKTWYKVRLSILESSLLETSKLDCWKPANLSAGNQQTITETTTETTCFAKAKPTAGGSLRVAPARAILLNDSHAIDTKEDWLVNQYVSLSIKKGWHRHKAGPPVKGATRDGWQPKTIAAWRLAAGQLIKRYGRLAKVVWLWWKDNAGEEFVPVACTFGKFCSKFDDIARARERSLSRLGVRDERTEVPTRKYNN